MDPRIASAFASGVILAPESEHSDLVHLTRALAKLAGVKRFDSVTLPVRRILDCVGQPRHVVFVLLDGFGMNLTERLAPSSFLRSNLRMSLRATTPSTTACALTSIATGEWPSKHAVTGWYTHVPEHGLTVTTLHMVERFSGTPVGEYGLDARGVCPIAAYHPEMSATSLTLLPAAIADTEYARYARGGTAFAPYDDLPHASEQIVEFVQNASGATFTHLYVPDVDSVCHHQGLEDESVTALLLRLDELLSRLSDALPKDARLVVTADHGLIGVKREDHLPLSGEDFLTSLLAAPPSGDGRMPIFHVREGQKDAFVASFASHFGDHFVLMERAEAEVLGLFGPGPMSTIARRRFGDYVGIALGPVVLHYSSHRGPPPQQVYVAQHGGLTSEELLIPLVVA
jgi:hypothetical protein